ncbi:HutD family protein [Defluviimonas aestuarii]|uniref:HutD/Ves family protein n=1 Tax=Albidovulum aestuarii TaxID=1130726 RepID=UPI00249CC3F7|nr:HutD family protein [Defluviimonas aestuarii]MDI3338743.1 HutD family protein [Defluviimonas aestuarii]
MHIVIRPEEFHRQPWKNGGGVTFEIARVEFDGHLHWRLSLAEVASDGPFSAFPGLARILTVIEGAGLILETPGGPIAAHPLDPVLFPGSLPVHARLIGGKVRDLNLIYDPALIDGAVRLVDAAHPLQEGKTAALFCLSGRFRLPDDEIGPGAVVLLDPGSPAPKAEPGATGLYISLQAASD